MDNNGNFFEHSYVMANKSSSTGFESKRPKDSGSLIYNHSNYSSGYNAFPFNFKNMAHAKLAWTFAHLFGVPSLLFAFISGFNGLYLNEIPFPELKYPWDIFVVLLGVIYGGFQICQLAVKIAHSIQGLREKLFDFKIKKINTKAIITTVSPDQAKLINDIRYFNSIQIDVHKIFYKTIGDRFLIVVANNGREDLKFATVMYEKHKDPSQDNPSVNATERYEKYEFDEHFNKMLKDLRYKNIDMVVANAEPSELKTILEGEKVTHIMIFYLTKIIRADGNANLFYCSVATHSGEFSDKEKLIIGQYIQNIRAQTDNAIEN